MGRGQGEPGSQRRGAAGGCPPAPQRDSPPPAVSALRGRICCSCRCEFTGVCLMPESVVLTRVRRAEHICLPALCLGTSVRWHRDKVG